MNSHLIIDHSAMWFFLILSTSVSFISAFPVMSEFQTTDCYKALENDHISYLLYHNAPIGPPFLQTEIEAFLEPKNRAIENKKASATYYMMRNDGPCTNSLQFSKLGLDYLVWNIDVNLYHGLNYEYYGEARYTIDSDFDLNMQRLVSISNDFAISVTFKNDAQDIIQTPVPIPLSDVHTALRKLHEDNGLICVITDNDGLIVVRPVYGSNQVPVCPISFIKAQYIRGGNTVESITLSAYGCLSRGDETSNIVFIREQPAEVDLQFKALCMAIPADTSTQNLPAPTTEYQFTLPNNYAVQISESANIGSSMRKVHLLDYLLETHKCGDNSYKFIQKSLNGLPFLGFAHEYITPVVGVKRQQIVFKNLESCQA